MVVGENAKAGDLEVNPVRAKATNNMRTQNKEEKMYLCLRLRKLELLTFSNVISLSSILPLY